MNESDKIDRDDRIPIGLIPLIKELGKAVKKAIKSCWWYNVVDATSVYLKQV